MFSRPTISISDPSFSASEVFQSVPYRRVAPILINAPEEIRQNVEGQKRLGVISPPSGRVGRVKEALVINRGIVLDQEHRIIKESLINYDNADSFEKEVSPAYDSAVVSELFISLPDKDGPYVIVKQTWDGNYGHWLIESLPRVETIHQQCGLSGLSFVVSDNTSPAMRTVYKDSLAMMGISADRVLSLPDDKAYRMHEVIYPTPLTAQPWVKSPLAIGVLESLRKYADPSTARPEKLFVSRNGWGNRRLLNEEDVLAVIRQYGYVVVQPEQYSFAQQISIFSKARIIIGTLGAAISNLVFSPSGVKLLSLTTELMGDDFFWDLVSLKQGQYVSLHGKASEPEKGMHSDFVIDLTDLMRALEIVEG